MQPNFPNPFAGFTTIGFTLPTAAPVNLRVFDLSGRQVANLINQSMPAGTHQVQWDASQMADGTYFLMLRTDAAVRTGKMILSKR